MSANPQFLTINGVGSPRIILSMESVLSDNNTVFGSNYVDFSTTPSPITMVRAGMRVTSYAAVSGQPDRVCYGKVVGVNQSDFIVYVDSWYPLQPTNGKWAYVDGWVIDLPDSQDMTETFEPDQLTHTLYRNRLVTKFYGWMYQCVLDYSKYIKPDLLIDARPLFSRETNSGTMVLIPHRDKPEFQYNVIFSQPVNLSPFGVSAGYRGVVLAFKGEDTIAGLPIVGTGYGYGYAYNYGVQY